MVVPEIKKNEVQDNVMMHRSNEGMSFGKKVEFDQGGWTQSRPQVTHEEIIETDNNWNKCI